MPSSSTLPALDAKQVKYLVDLYGKRPELFTEEKVNELTEAARSYGIEIPNDYHENYLVELPKQLLGGFIKEFTVFVDPFDQPKGPVGSIAKSIGGVFGFVGNFFGMGYPLKAVGKAIGRKGAAKLMEAEIAKEAVTDAGYRLAKLGQTVGSLDLKSVPMMAADAAMAGLKKIKALESSLQHLHGTSPILRQMVEQGMHLGLASAAASVPEGLPATIHSGLMGTLAGGGFAGIGNISALAGMPTSIGNVAKAAAGGIFQGLPSTMAGATTPEQVYNYLLGAYFGYHSTDYHSFDAMKAITSLNPAEQPAAMSNPRIHSMNLHPQTMERLGEMVKQTFKQEDTGRAMYKFLEALGPAGKKLSESMVGAIELPAGAEIPTSKGDPDVVIGLEGNFYRVRKAESGKEVMVPKREANHEWMRGVKTETRIDEVTSHVDTGAPRTDFDMLYADLMNDPVTRWVRDIFGPSVHPDVIEQHKKNISEYITTVVAETAQKGGTFDDAFRMFQDYIDNSSVAVTGKKVGDWGPIRQYFQRQFNGERVPILHFEKSEDPGKPNMYALKATPDNANIVIGPNWETQDTLRPVSPLEKASGVKDPMVFVKTFRDDKGVVRSLNHLVASEREQFVTGSDMMKGFRSFKLSEDSPAGEFYPSSGLESKGMVVGLKYRVNAQEALKIIEDVSNELFTTPKEKLAFGESFVKAQRRATESQWGMTEEEFQRAWASNLLYYRETFGAGQSLKEIFGGKKGQYINSLLDLNKRLQILLNSFYPLSPDAAGTPEYRYGVISDYGKIKSLDIGIKGPQGENIDLGSAITDGSVFILQSRLDSMLKAYGLPLEGGFGKPFAVSLDPNLGPMFVKAAFHAIPDNSQFGRWMKDQKYDQLIFTSSAKAFGKRKVGTLKKTGDTWAIENGEQYTMPVSDYMLSYQVYDKGGGNDPAHMAKQYWTNMDPLIAGEAAARFATENLTRANRTSGRAGMILRDFLKDGKDEDFNKLFKWREDGSLDSESYIHEIGLNDMLSAMRENPKFEAQALYYILRDAINANRKGGKIEEEWDAEETSELTTKDLQTAIEFLRINDPKKGISTGLIHYGGATKLVSRILHNFFVKRVTRPLMQGSFKAIMRGWDPELLEKLPYEKDKFYLDEGWRDIIITGIDVSGAPKKMTLEEQVAIRDHLVDEVAKLGEPGDGKALYIHKTMRATLERANEALEAVVLRVPQDNISGARALKFGGFTGRKGGGILLHNDIMNALGGADLDIDSAFGYFGMTKAEKDALRTNAEAYDRYNDPNGPYANAKDVLVSKDPVLTSFGNLKAADPVALFDPFARTMVGLNVSNGREFMLPMAVSYKFTTLEFAGAALRRAMQKPGWKPGDPLTVRFEWGEKRKLKSKKIRAAEERAREERREESEGVPSDEALGLPKPTQEPVSAETVDAGDKWLAKPEVQKKKREFSKATTKNVKENENDGDTYGQDYVVLTLADDNLDALRALGSHAINLAADLAGVGGMVGPNELLAMYVKLAFPRMELHTAEGAVREIDDGSARVNLKTGESFIDPSYSRFVGDMRWRIKEWRSLMEANSAIYGRDRNRQRAWTPGEVREKLRGFDYAFYQGRPFAKVVETLADMDTEYSYTRDIANNPAILDAMEKHFSTINDLLFNDKETRQHFAFLKRDTGVSFSYIRNMFRILSMHGSFGKKNVDPDVYIAGDISTARGRREMSRWENRKEWEKLFDALKANVSPATRKNNPNWIKGRYFAKKGAPPDERFMKMRQREAFLERVVRQTNDFFAKRMDELTSYPYLAEMYQRSSVMELKETPFADDVGQMLDFTWRKSNRQKLEHSRMYGEELAARARAAKDTSVPNEKPSKKTVSGKMRVEPKEEFRNPTVDEAAILKNLDMRRQNRLVQMNRAMEDLRRYDESELFYEDEVQAGEGSSFGSLTEALYQREQYRRKQSAMRQDIDNLKMELDAIVGEYNYIRDGMRIEKPVRELRIFNTPGDVYADINEHRQWLVNWTKEMQDKLTSTGSPIMLSTRGVLDMYDAFLMSPLTRRKPTKGDEDNYRTIHSSLGMKVAGHNAIEAFRRHYDSTYSMFVQPEEMDSKYIKQWLLGERNFAKTVDMEPEKGDPKRKFVHERVMVELLPQGEIKDPEVQKLYESILGKLQRFSPINQMNLVPILRDLFKIAQPHQLTVFELRGLDETLESWLRGPGFFREYIKIKERAEKDPSYVPPPQWRHYVQFMETTADEMKRHVITLVDKQLYDENGMVNDRKLDALKHLDENGRLTYVYAHQVHVSTPIHKLMGIMRRASGYTAMKRAMFNDILGNSLGWVKNGIMAVGSSVDEQDKFFENAWARRELEGAYAEKRSARETRRATFNADYPKYLRASDQDIDRIDNDVNEYRVRLDEYNDFFEGVRNKDYIVTSPDGSGKKLTVKGWEVNKMIQDGMRKWADEMWKHVQISDKEVAENIEFEIEGDVIRVSPSRSWKAMRRLYDYDGLLNPEDHLSNDLVRYAHYIDDLHFYAREKANQYRRSNQKFFKPDGTPVSLKELVEREAAIMKAGEEGKALFTDEGYTRGKKDLIMKELAERRASVDKFAFASEETQRAARHIPGILNIPGASKKWAYLSSYLEGMETHRPDKPESGYEFNVKEGRQALNRFVTNKDLRKRGFEEGLKAAKRLFRKPEAWRDQYDNAWEVKNYIRHSVSKKKLRKVGTRSLAVTQSIFDKVYGYTHVSEYDLDQMFVEGTISPEMYFFKKQEIQKPFVMTKFREGYMPHLNFDRTVAEAWQERQIAAIMKGWKPETMTSDEKRALNDRIAKVKQAFMQHEMETKTEDGYLNSDLADLFNSDAESISTAAIAKMEKMTAFTAGNLLQRTFNMPGYEKHMLALEQYASKVARATYNTFSAFQAKRLLDVFERRQLMKNSTKQWSWFLRFYFRDALGYPSIFTQEQLSDPELNLRKMPYYWLSDHAAFINGSFMQDAALKLLGLDKLSKVEEAELTVKLGHKPSEKEIQSAIADKKALLTDPKNPQNLARFGNQLRQLSILEGQYQLMTLLASLRSGVGNIVGGAVNNVIWNGWHPVFSLYSPKRMETFQRINPQWKTMDDVHRFVLNSGVIEQFIIEEGGLTTRKYGHRTKEFLDAVINKVKKDPSVSDKTILELAKQYGIKESLLEKAGWIMKHSERINRINAFLSTYLQARSDVENGMPLDPDNPWLIEVARKGMNATQFLYANDTRPPFARTNLGHIYSRFKLWAWSSVKFQRQIYEAARDRGFRPGTVEMERFKRLMTANIFAVGLASLLPYSMFDASLPAPLSWFQNLADWMFGDDKERERAFFTGSTGLPTILAPLNELLPPVARVPKGVFDAPETFASIWGSDIKHAATLTTYSLFPFGRMAKDVWRAYNDPAATVDVLTGLPLTTIARMKRKAAEDEKKRAEAEAQMAPTPKSRYKELREQLKTLSESN